MKLVRSLEGINLETSRALKLKKSGFNPPELLYTGKYGFFYLVFEGDKYIPAFSSLNSDYVYHLELSLLNLNSLI